MKYDREEILKKITPSQEEIERGFDLCRRIKKYIKKKYRREATVQGSFAKDTSLKGDKDLDIFIFFPLETSREELKKRALQIGKDVFEEFDGSYKVKYAEHPYVHGEIEKHDVDIVPCYNIQTIEEMKSSVDRTPLHTQFVLHNMTDRQKNETRILKKYMKLVDVYGSEFKIRGFSGYLCELLIIYYGSFEDVLKVAARWKKNQTISFNGTEREFSDPLTIIDPVDTNRNAASCVSLQKFAEFIYYARKFLNDRKFESVQREYTRAPGTELLVLQFETEIMEELLFPQLRKTRDFLCQQLEDHGFRIYRTGVFNTGILLELEVSTLPKTKMHEGPFIYDRENCKKFIETHRDVFVRDDRLCTEIAREFTTARACVETLIEKREGFGKDLKDSPCRITKVAVKKIYD